MKVVAFDTATVDTVVCATRDGAVLYEESLGPAADGAPRHSTALLPEVECAAEAAGGWDEVERLAVGLGPGSFVGIRIALATARGLSASTGKPATGICTLDAIGLALGEADGEREGLAVLDARRGEVFAALYSGAGGRAWDPFVAGPNELAERLAGLSSPPLAAGAGAVRFRSELAGAGAEIPDDADPLHRVAARCICALAEAATDVDAGPLEPIYLRPPDAERWRERDTFQRAG